MPLSDEQVLDGIIHRLLRVTDKRAIIVCARRKYGMTRDLDGILAVAKELKADRKTVAAAMGFLPSLESPGKYVDMENQNCCVAYLPRKQEAAFALFRRVAGEIEAGLAYDIPQ